MVIAAAHLSTFPAAIQRGHGMIRPDITHPADRPFPVEPANTNDA